MSRSMFAVLVLTVGLAATGHAQTTSLGAHIDPSRLQAGVDSFTVLMRGTPMGWQRLSRQRLPQSGEWELRDAVALGSMVSQESVISLSATLAERTLRQTGVMRGTPMRIAMDFAAAPGGVRATGQSDTPTNPGKVLAIDTIVPTGTIEDNAMTPLVASVRWREGMDIRVPVLSSGKGTMAEYRLRVLQADTLTVPAGHFEVWRIEQQAERSTVTLFITRAAPYRLVRMQQNGTPLDIVLVSTRAGDR